MSPSRGVRWSALVGLTACFTLPAIPAVAQSVFDDPSPFLEGRQDPLARSPRLLGMGRLSYVLDDAHQRINLWDLGKNPIGVIDADTASTLELAPSTGAVSSVSDRFGVAPGTTRQTYGDRDVRTYYEAWRRAGTTTYGAEGDLSSGRSDQPYDETLERRNLVGRPSIMPVLAGRLPVGKSDQFTFALRALIATPSDRAHFRRYVTNAAGEFIDLDGTQVDPPDFFQPLQSSAHSLGFGTHVGVRITSSVRAAIGVDFVSHNLVARNQGFRNAFEIREQRPYRIGKVSIVGRTAGLQWGADANGWRANSDQTYVFSTSAGTATDPLEGRGKRFDRKEEGSSLRARVRWQGRSLEIGAGLSSAYRKTEITPPLADDVNSFNHFLDLVFLRDGADTLSIPDSIVFNRTADRSWEAGGGAAWKFGSGRSVLGLEGHYFQSRRDQDLSGPGPKALGWDVRSGIEFPLFAALSMRAGVLHRWEDRDDFTKLNEYVTNSATTGFGLHPASAKWTFDAGYAFEWTSADFDTPNDPRTGSQRLATRVRWLF